MDTDLLGRLRIDPGQRTIGQLIQDREAAAQEIYRLNRELESLRAKRTSATKAPANAVGEQAIKPGSLLRLGDVCERVGVCRSTIYRWVSEGTFPAPIKISSHAVRWQIDDIESWRHSLRSDYD